MRLVSYVQNGIASFGPVVGEGVVDAGRRLGIAGLRAALADDRLEAVRAIAAEPADCVIDAVTLLPVVPDPGKIICVGVNYANHLEETGRDAPAYPMLFSRFASSQVGHGQPILRPMESDRLDFEGELAVVIGTGGRGIARENALAHVAGYSCYNDATLRDWQRHTSQFMPGKNFDVTGAFGPWLVTADEVADPSVLTLETRLNGQMMQSAPLSDLIFDVPTLIAYASRFATLAPGDVIVTGTPGGVGAFRDPPVWMEPGDIIEIEISGIGVLRNPIAQG